MARKSLKVRAKPKYSTRIVRRCSLCGRPRSVFRRFSLCRMCLLLNIRSGNIPGFKKLSW